MRDTIGLLLSDDEIEALEERLDDDFKFKELPPHVQRRFLEVAPADFLEIYCTRRYLCKLLHTFYHYETAFAYRPEKNQFVLDRSTLKEHGVVRFNAQKQVGKVSISSKRFGDTHAVHAVNRRVPQKHRIVLNNLRFPFFGQIVSCLELQLTGVVLTQNRFFSSFNEFSQLRVLYLSHVTFHPVLRLEQLLKNLRRLTEVQIHHCNVELDLEACRFLSEWDIPSLKRCEFGVVNFNEAAIDEYISRFIAKNHCCVRLYLSSAPDDAFLMAFKVKMDAIFEEQDTYDEFDVCAAEYRPGVHFLEFFVADDTQRRLRWLLRRQFDEEPKRDGSVSSDGEAADSEQEEEEDVEGDRLDYRRRYPKQFNFNSLPYTVQFRFFELSYLYLGHRARGLPCWNYHKMMRTFLTVSLKFNKKTKLLEMDPNSTDHCIPSLQAIEGCKVKKLKIHGLKRKRVWSTGQPLRKNNLILLSNATLPLLGRFKVRQIRLTDCRVPQAVLEDMCLTRLWELRLEDSFLEPPLKLSHLLTRLRDVERLRLLGCNLTVERDDLQFLSTWTPRNLEKITLGLWDYDLDLFRRYLVPFITNNSTHLEQVTLYVHKITGRQQRLLIELRRYVNNGLRSRRIEKKCWTHCDHRERGSSYYKINFFVSDLDEPCTDDEYDSDEYLEPAEYLPPSSGNEDAREPAGSEEEDKENEQVVVKDAVEGSSSKAINGAGPGARDNGHVAGNPFSFGGGPAAGESDDNFDEDQSYYVEFESG